MLNIDTQGAELMVLKGASKVLENVKVINCEVTFFNPHYHNNPKFDEVNSLLQQFGFKHVDTELCLEKNWGDAIFEKSL